MEHWRFLRLYIWTNAGFGLLRKIREAVIDYEPFFEPTIVPLPDTSPDQGNGPAALVQPASPPASHKYPASRYYSAINACQES